MKAMVLKKAGPIETSPLELSDVSDPEPQKGEIRIKVTACGLCHTDLHVIEEEIPLFKLPIIPGHQIVGVIDKLGPESDRFWIGERVGVPWLNATCGSCQYCEREEENLCENARFTGYHVDGGYAEYAVVPEAFSYRIPEGYPDLDAAPLLCAGIIGFRALRLSEVKPGEKLGLFGFGASAHIVLQIARYWDCEVYVFTRSEAHRHLAQSLGAVWTGRAEDEPPAALDRTIVFAPAGRLVLDALRVLRKGGTQAIASIYMDKIPQFDYNTLLYGERTIRSVTASTRMDARQLLEIAPLVPIKTEIEVFPLEEANRGLQLLKEGQIRGAGVLQVSKGN